MHYVELFDNKVIRLGEAEILPVLALPSKAIDITNYKGDVKVGYIYNAELNSFEYGENERPAPIDPIEPEQPVEPVETIDDKLTRLEIQLQEQQQQNLILVDINLTVYEELLNMKEQFAQLTGAKDNA